MSDLDILIIATVAWLRNEFNVLLGAQDVADVGRRAFSLLGAELRTLVRELLAALELHDLLAALPPEPSV